MQAGEFALQQLGFDDFQACKLSAATDICKNNGNFVQGRMKDVVGLGWEECDIRWHTWRDFDNFQKIWPLMDPLNDLNALQEMLSSLGVDFAVRSFHGCSSPICSIFCHAMLLLVASSHCMLHECPKD